MGAAGEVGCDAAEPFGALLKRPKPVVPVAFSRAVVLIPCLAARLDVSVLAALDRRLGLTVGPCAAEENASKGERQADASARRPPPAQRPSPSCLAPVDDVPLTKPAPSPWARLVLAGRAAAGAGAPRPLASVVAVAAPPTPLHKAV